MRDEALVRASSYALENAVHKLTEFVIRDRLRDA